MRESRGCPSFPGGNRVTGTPAALRILVVDGHPQVRDGLRAGVLATFPTALVEAAGSGAEALAYISANAPDLILLDSNLPGEDGIDLARRIRASDERVKLLVVADRSAPWKIDETLKAGASGFIGKTQSAGSFGQSLKRILDGQIVICPDTQSGEQPRPAQVDAPGPGVLSRRELEILKHFAQGENTKAIASLLQISPKTVETHRQHIMRKLGIGSIAGLTRYAIRHGLIPV